MEISELIIPMESEESSSNGVIPMKPISLVIPMGSDESPPTGVITKTKTNLGMVMASKESPTNGSIAKTISEIVGPTRPAESVPKRVPFRWKLTNWSFRWGPQSPLPMLAFRGDTAN